VLHDSLSCFPLKTAEIRPLLALTGAQLARRGREAAAKLDAYLAEQMPQT
jgi:hypothetical protein